MSETTQVRPYDDAPMPAEPSMPSRRARRRHRRWPWVIGLFVVVCVWAVFTVLSLNKARERTQSGIDRLEQARNVLTPTGLVRGDGIELLRAAHRDFSSARSQVRSPLMVPLRVLPFLGRQVRSVDAMTGAAADVVDAGVNAIDASRSELRRVKPHGHQRVLIVQTLARIATDAHRRIAGVDLGPSDALIGPLKDARQRFARELSKLEDATNRSATASRGMAQFLRGPSTYLVFAANNNEMRVGSGTFLSVGVLTVRDGSFDLGEMTPTVDYALPPGAVTLTGDFAKRWGWLEPNQEWRNLASSPIFPTQAALASKMWSALGKPPIDGALALDPVALRSLIQATHPVTIEGKQYGADNVLQEIYLNQYNGIIGIPQNEVRRDRLSEIARAAIRNLQGDFQTVDLVDSLRYAADGRHILGWSRLPAQQAGWSAAGIAGTVGPSSLLLGVHNRGGNKLDQFLDLSAHLGTKRDAQGTAVTIAIGLHNAAPPGLPQYVTGPYPNAVGSREGLYQGLLVAELPRLARTMYITGADGKRLPLVAVGRDQGSWVVAAYVEAARGTTARATVHFRLPVGVKQVRVEPSARVPAIEWQSGTQQWHDDQAHDLAW
ncbi:MAG: hypothetical protein QOI55_1079 [Actinomycetota bacterium]|jgi:hypothetical protein|nr:hypothetical protein [Actinomycetota bacterium]